MIVIVDDLNKKYVGIDGKTICRFGEISIDYVNNNFDLENRKAEANYIKENIYGKESGEGNLFNDDLNVYKDGMPMTIEKTFGNISIKNVPDLKAYTPLHDAKGHLYQAFEVDSMDELINFDAEMRSVYNIVTYVCLNCGREYVPIRKDNSLYCSDTCRERVKQRRDLEKQKLKKAITRAVESQPEFDFSKGDYLIENIRKYYDSAQIKGEEYFQAWINSVKSFFVYHHPDKTDLTGLYKFLLKEDIE